MKLLDIDFNKIDYSSSKNLLNTFIINLKYFNEYSNYSFLEFQTPKGKIISINDKIIIMSIKKKEFIDKIIELENEYFTKTNKNIKIFNIKSSIINDNELIIKIPSRNNSKNIKIFDSNNNFILFGSLKIGDTIIVNIVNKTLSVNNSILYYYFHAKEILIIK